MKTFFLGFLWTCLPKKERTYLITAQISLFNCVKSVVASLSLPLFCTVVCVCVQYVCVRDGAKNMCVFLGKDIVASFNTFLAPSLACRPNYYSRDPELKGNPGSAQSGKLEAQSTFNSHVSAFSHLKATTATASELVEQAVFVGKTLPFPSFFLSTPPRPAPPPPPPPDPPLLTHPALQDLLERRNHS